VPALLNAIGKLEVVAGDFDAAQRDFEQVTTLTKDAGSQAEAHFNAYRAALERRDWDAALRGFSEAVRLDARRFALFPVGKYQPKRILGAGGFGVAFLCKHKYMDAPVVVKALTAEDLGRDADKVFTEAQVLRELDHPAIIRISDCGYVDSGSRSWPFLVMDYFQGVTLEEHVEKHGPLPVVDLVAVARQVAAGLQAAHGKGILHRDVKPANLLVRKEKSGWRVKVIDFGLALRQSADRNTTVKGKPARTLLATSIAGTLDYPAPEQLGRLRGVSASPASDVYGFAKTCCYALFQTTQPLPKHWHSIPPPLAQVMERCLEEDPNKRPQGFAEILGKLTGKAVALNAAGGGADTATFDPAVEKSLKQGTLATKELRRRSKLPLVIGAGVGLAVVILVVLFSGLFSGKPATNADQPRAESYATGRSGRLVLKVDQPEAELYVDGTRYRLTRPGDEEMIEIEVREGPRHLKVVKDGFEPYTKDFTVASGEKKTVQVRLKPIGWVERRAAEWVLQIGGKLSIKMDKGNDNIALDASSHHLPEVPFSIIVIDLENNKSVTALGLKNLEGLRRIQELNCWNSSVDDAGMASVCTLGSLTMLSIGFTKVTDGGLLQLERLDQLTELRLVGLPLGDQGMSHVGKLVRLETLRMAKVQVGDTGLAQLKGLHNLKSLFLQENSQVTDAAMDSLKSLSNLKSISVAGTKITDGAIRRNFPGCTIAR
jgi:hypothetical protein